MNAMPAQDDKKAPSSRRPKVTAAEHSFVNEKAPKKHGPDGMGSLKKAGCA